ncbi:MAG: DNA repair protein RecO C-terminal domain-containing protein, partial [Frankiaceae bacterium]|nr:DNA repair protein RecO C-terminal domain-containing protein [Frankiaceae bacterium]
HRYFAVALGGLVCREHRPPGSASVSPQSLGLMGALLSGDWSVADAAEDRTQRETSGLVAAYLQWHLEHGLRSLRLVERQ